MANEDMTISLLKASLLDLLHALTGTGIRLMLGGGFGLYLKQLYLQEKDPRTLIDGELRQVQVQLRVVHQPDDFARACGRSRPRGHACAPGVHDEQT